MKYVSSYKDRHGKTRWKFRRGKVSEPLHGSPGEPQFEEEYQAALAGKPIRKQRRRGHAIGTKGRRGILYVVQCGNEAPVKIGFTAPHYLKMRLTALQIGNANKLDIIAQAKVFFWQEKAAHIALSEHRITGEWFLWTPAVAAFVAALPKGIDAALSAVTRGEVVASNQLDRSTVFEIANPLI